MGGLSTNLPEPLNSRPFYTKGRRSRLDPDSSIENLGIRGWPLDRSETVAESGDSRRRLRRYVAELHLEEWVMRRRASTGYGSGRPIPILRTGVLRSSHGDRRNAFPCG